MVAKLGKFLQTNFFCIFGLHTSTYRYKIYQVRTEIWQLFEFLVHPRIYPSVPFVISSELPVVCPLFFNLFVCLVTSGKKIYFEYFREECLLDRWELLICASQNTFSSPNQTRGQSEKKVVENDKLGVSNLHNYKWKNWSLFSKHLGPPLSRERPVWLVWMISFG